MASHALMKHSIVIGTIECQLNIPKFLKFNQSTVNNLHFLDTLITKCVTNTIYIANKMI